MKRMPPTERKETILQAATILAARDGFHNVTKEAVARESGVSAGLVLFYFFTMEELRESVMQRAITDGHHSIVLQGLAYCHPTAQEAPLEVRQAAAATLGV